MRMQTIKNDALLAFFLAGFSIASGVIRFLNFQDGPNIMLSSAFIVTGILFNFQSNKIITKYNVVLWQK